MHMIDNWRDKGNDKKTQKKNLKYINGINGIEVSPSVSRS